jgi:hypothetical protein
MVKVKFLRSFMRNWESIVGIFQIKKIQNLSILDFFRDLLNNDDLLK